MERSEPRQRRWRQDAQIATVTAFGLVGRSEPRVLRRCGVATPVSGTSSTPPDWQLQSPPVSTNPPCVTSLLPLRPPSFSTML